MKKNVLLRSMAIVFAIALGTTTVSAQKFLNKVKKATESVISTDSESTSVTEEGDGPSVKEFIESVPSYSVKKVIEVDDDGNVLKNEDGTEKFSYQLIDKNGNVCDVNAANKHLKAAWASAGIVLAKVGGGAAVGALSSQDKKKGALIGAGVGALTSANDIKNVKEQVKLMKECKVVLDAYQKTFTDEGLPKDASIDLTNVDGIDFTKSEQITKSAADVKAEKENSKAEGESLKVEDVDWNALG